MVCAVRLLPDESVDLCVGLDGGARLHLRSSERVEGFLSEDFPCELDALSELQHVGVGGEVVGLDDRVGKRVSALQLEPPNTRAPHGSNMNLEGLDLGFNTAVIDDLRGQEMELNIRMRNARTTANEPATLQMSRCTVTCESEKPFQADLYHVEGLLGFVECDGLSTAMLHIYLQMILEITAHTCEHMTTIPSQAEATFDVL